MISRACVEYVFSAPTDPLPFSNRSPNTFAHPGDQKKSPWSKHEKTLFLRILQTHAIDGQWARLAAVYFPEHTGRRCQERFEALASNGDLIGFTIPELINRRAAARAAARNESSARHPGTFSTRIHQIEQIFALVCENRVQLLSFRLFG